MTALFQLSRLKLQRQQTQIAVLKLLPHTGVAEVLQGLGRSLEKIARALADYLDVKRSSFPRLYMLSKFSFSSPSLFSLSLSRVRVHYSLFVSIMC